MQCFGLLKSTQFLVMAALSSLYFLCAAMAILSIMIYPCKAQQCNTLLSFNGTTLNFAKCKALPTQSAGLAWTFNTENSTLDVAFTGTAASDSGWVGWGINPLAAAQMVGSSALIAFQSSQNGSNVLPYKLTSDVQTLNVPLTCSPVDLTIQATAVEIQGTSMSFFAALQLKPNKTVLNLVWNRGSSVVNFQPQEHSLSAEDLQGYQTIDIFTTQTVSGVGGPPYESLKRTHGIINTIAWGILLPLGGIIGRYLRQFPAMAHVWFKLHVGCQLLGYVLGTVGWALGMRLRAVSAAIRQPHQNIGISLFALATLQVTALVYHPHKGSKYRKYWVVYHHALGYTIIVLGPVNVFLGLHILDPGPTWRVGYIASLCVLGIVALLLEAASWICFAYNGADNL